ncbi:type II toxin-antitoxin system VapC family toxin [Moraxella oblonga]|uniref:type II toxin-antitoxin system VapC family toxin n=1 Tax=Moraxella oblonga TaxID=200413 RepID=UPI000AA52795|nr:PIN domain nuclease [Moraxella oblonga]
MNMIIVDTSVWIDYFNGKDTTHCEFLDNVLKFNQIGICDLILMEVLQGFKNDKDYLSAKSALSNLPIFNIINKDNAIIYADYHRTLRKQGINTIKSNHVMIAGFCIQQDLPLLFSDSDFLPFCKHLGLKLAL